MEDKALQKKIDVKKYVTAEVGMPTLTDIMAELYKPGLDPRGEVEKLYEHVTVRVAEVDLKRKRIALSMKGI